MFEMKSSLVTLLVVFSLSLLASGAAGNERKRWQSVFKTIMELGDPSKEPSVSLEFVGQELEKWRLLEDGQKVKFLDTASSELMDRLSALNRLRRVCDSNHLVDRFAIERDFDSTYTNLHPYIKFTNLMLLNMCYQDYKYRLMLLINIDLDKNKFLAWYDATEDEIDEEEFKIAALSGAMIRSSADEDRELKNVSAKLALYLKHFYPKIESKYFKSSEEHADKIKFEVEGILNAVCRRLTNLNSNSASDTELGRASQRQIPPGSVGSINSDYNSLMKRAAASVDGEDIQAFAGNRLYKYQWVCQKDNRMELIAKVQRYFEEKLDGIEFVDRTTADWPDISRQELISTKEILFAKHDFARLRMGHPYNLLNRLYTGMKDGSLAGDSEHLARLFELSDISPDKCLMFNSQLDERLSLEATYDYSYVVLHPYVASSNRLQYDLCNQILRQLASNAIPRDAIQLVKLEKLRTSIKDDSHERVDPTAFAIGVADLLFLSSTVKIPNRLVPRKLEKILDEACRDVAQSLSLVSILETHDALIKYRLVGPMNDATKRALSYGRICKYYEQNKLRVLSQMVDRNGWFQSAPGRHPEHLLQGSRLSCLRPKVIE